MRGTNKKCTTFWCTFWRPIFTIKLGAKMRLFAKMLAADLSNARNFCSRLIGEGGGSHLVGDLGYSGLILHQSHVLFKFSSCNWGLLSVHDVSRHPVLILRKRVDCLYPPHQEHYEPLIRLMQASVCQEITFGKPIMYVSLRGLPLHVKILGQLCNKAPAMT